MRKLSYSLSIVAGAALLSLSGAAFAVSSNANAHADKGGRPSGSPEASASASPGAGNPHAAAGKLNACVHRQQAVQNIMARIVDRGTKQIAVFDAIATRTETFYTTKGKTVSNYSTLVAAVDSAKTKAQTDLAGVKAADTFSCDASNPKGMVSAFQSTLKMEIADLKAYKTAVKNLIVAVKSAQGSDSGSGAESSDSPKPSSSASPSPTSSASPSASASPQGGN